MTILPARVIILLLLLLPGSVLGQPKENPAVPGPGRTQATRIALVSSVQSEAIRNGIPLEGKKDAFQIVDVNNDGYLDIKILGGETQGKAWYKVWLYDTDKGTFVWRAKD